MKKLIKKLMNKYVGYNVVPSLRADMPAVYGISKDKTIVVNLLKLKDFSYFTYMTYAFGYTLGCVNDKEAFTEYVRMSCYLRKADLNKAWSAIGLLLICMVAQQIPDTMMRLLITFPMFISAYFLVSLIDSYE